MTVNIDTSKFGTNGFRSKMTRNGGVLTISQRGWLSCLFFVIVAAILAAVIRTKQIEFSGVAIFLYAAAPFSLLIGFLYALYVQEVSFDTDNRRFMLRRGFLGFTRKTDAPFNEITGISVREVRLASKEARSTRTRTMIMWDIGIECKTNRPLFDIWKADNKETAFHIANTLADALGSKVVIEDNK